MAARRLVASALLLTLAPAANAAGVIIGAPRAVDDVPYVAALAELQKAELPKDGGGRYSLTSGSYWNEGVARHGFDGEGRVVGERLALPEAGTVRVRKVANLPDGTARAVWEDGACNAVLAVFGSDGSVTTSPVKLPDNPGCGQGSVAYVPHHDGSWWRVLDGESAGHPGALLVIRIRESGAEAARRIPILPRWRGTQLDLHRGLAFDDDGSLVMAWASSPRSSRTVHLRVLGPDGTVRQRRARLAGEADSSWGIHAQSVAPGHVVVGWRSAPSHASWVGRDIWLGADPGAGAEPAPALRTVTSLPGLAPVAEFSPTHLGAMTLADARLQTDGHGTWVVTWSHAPLSGRSTVFVDVSHDHGRTWSGPLPIGPGSSPVLASNGRRNWLLAAFDCLWGDPSECVWRVWRSADRGDHWASGLDEYSEGWVDYFSASDLRDSDVHTGEPTLESSGPGDWSFAIQAFDESSSELGNIPMLFTWRSADDGRSWRSNYGYWEESFVDWGWGPIPSPAVLAFPGREPLAAWRLTTLRGARIAPATGEWSARIPRTLTPSWSDHGPSRLAGEGFSADVDENGIGVAVWSSRNLSVGGWGWDGDVVSSRTEDGGETWSEPAPLDPGAWSDTALDDQPQVGPLGDGRWIATWRSMNPAFSGRAGEATALASVSTDGGRSWSHPTPIDPPGPGVHLPPPGLASMVTDHRGRRRGWAVLWGGLEAGSEGGTGLSWLSMTPPDSQCGDGARQADEECDDGNATEGDGCDSNCRATACGNGVRTGDEECDDGNRWGGDACSADCRPTSCGDGDVRWDGEECDDGNAVDGDGCDTNCTRTFCGNGIVTEGEECDGGRTGEDVGCDPNCTIPRCGNGFTGAGEECDDGNPRDDDSCTTGCLDARCGDGLVRANSCPPRRPDCSWGKGEECDDGNTNEDDACLTTCVANRCGDGHLSSALETCDDGNGLNSDGCDENCTPTGCGNNVVSNGELCDDGDKEDGGGCSADCLAFPTVCGDVDADGVVTQGDAAAIEAAADSGADCPLWRCDLDSDLEVTDGDAELARRKVAGLEVPRGCEREVTFLASSLPQGAYAWVTVSHAQAVGTFWETRGRVHCRPLEAPSVADETTGRLGLLLQGRAETLPGPLPMLACRLRAFGPVEASDFELFVVEDGSIDPPPVVTLRVD